MHNRSASSCWFLTIRLNFKLHTKIGRTTLPNIIARNRFQIDSARFNKVQNDHSHHHPQNGKMPTTLIQKLRQLENNASPLKLLYRATSLFTRALYKRQLRNYFQPHCSWRGEAFFDVLWATGSWLQQEKIKGHFSPMKWHVDENLFLWGGFLKTNNYTACIRYPYQRLHGVEYFSVRQTRTRNSSTNYKR